MEDINVQKPTILIVDDAVTNIQILSDLLKNEYEIKVAKSGPSALKIACEENSHLDLILLDVSMPDMDGYEVCETLKKNEKSKDIPVIFVTGNDALEDEEKGLGLGAADYIRKPFKPTIVQIKVKNHVELKLHNDTIKKISLDLEAKAQELERYIKIVDQNVITSSTDLAGNITAISEKFCQVSGYKKEELLGKNHRIVRHPDMDEEVYAQMWETLHQNKIWCGELQNRSKSGESYWVYATISPLYDDAHKKIGYTAIRHDITDKKRIEEISITDGLTSVFNRRYFNDIAPHLLNRAKRSDEFLNFLMIDIDHFKLYNDNYGHQKGDEVLQTFANVCKEAFKRADDFVFRLGGEEFGIIYISNDKACGLLQAQNLKKMFSDIKIEHLFSPTSKEVTLSMGLVCKNAFDIESIESIYKQADELLYKSKHNGRDTITTLE